MVVRKSQLFYYWEMTARQMDTVVLGKTMPRSDKMINVSRDITFHNRPFTIPVPPKNPQQNKQTTKKKKKKNLTKKERNKKPHPKTATKQKQKQKQKTKQNKNKQTTNKQTK